MNSFVDNIIFKQARAHLFAHSWMVSSISTYCLQTVKWSQGLISNTNSFICTQLNDQALLSNSNYSI